MPQGHMLQHAHDTDAYTDYKELNQLSAGDKSMSLIRGMYTFSVHLQVRHHEACLVTTLYDVTVTTFI